MRWAKYSSRDSFGRAGWADLGAGGGTARTSTRPMVTWIVGADGGGSAGRGGARRPAPSAASPKSCLVRPRGTARVTGARIFPAGPDGASGVLADGIVSAAGAAARGGGTAGGAE